MPGSLGRISIRAGKPHVTAAAGVSRRILEPLGPAANMPSDPKRLDVLIAGAGIAGLSLALALLRRGHRSHLVERAPAPRDEGYMMDFFGPGFTAAERMELLPELARIHYPIPRLSFVDREGEERFALPYPLLRRRLFRDRHFNFMRGALERVLLGAVSDDVEVRFGTTVESFRDDGTRVAATLAGGGAVEADVLVAADGVHSATRGLLFPDVRPVRPLGYSMASYILDDPALSAEVGEAFRTLTVPGRQVAVYPIRGGRVATFFLAEAERDPGSGRAPTRLQATYGDLGWLVPRLLNGGGDAADLFVDAVEQVVLPGAWSRGRTGLLGDACWCVSPLAGQGASLAMAGAWVLAEELDRTPEDPAGAFTRYEGRMRPVVEKDQEAGRTLARWFVPSSRPRVVLRDLFLRLSIRRPFAWIARRGLSGDDALP